MRSIHKLTHFKSNGSKHIIYLSVNMIKNKLTCVKKPTIYTEKPTAVEEVDLLMNDENINAKPI